MPNLPILGNLNDGITPLNLGGVTSNLNSTFSNSLNQVQSNVSNSLINGIDSFASSVLGNAYSGTIGAVLNNGLNLSCWGASLTPQDAQKKINDYYKPYFDYLLNQVNTSSNNIELQLNVNQFIKNASIIYQYYFFIKMGQASWSNCAKKAINEVYKPYMQQVFNKSVELINLLITKGAIVTYADNQQMTYMIPKEVSGKSSNYTNTSDKKVNHVPSLVLANVPVVIPEQTPVTEIDVLINETTPQELPFNYDVIYEDENGNQVNQNQNNQPKPLKDAPSNGINPLWWLLLLFGL